VQGDFEPISLTVTIPMVIVSKNAAPAKNFPELIGWLKANPEKTSAGTTERGRWTAQSLVSGSRNASASAVSSHQRVMGPGCHRALPRLRDDLGVES
jgi:tripartite-type tricarboxylate transporter receptor subunit TctC